MHKFSSYAHGETDNKTMDRLEQYWNTDKIYGNSHFKTGRKEKTKVLLNRIVWSNEILHNTCIDFEKTALWP